MYREFWQLFGRQYGRGRMLLLICVVTVAVALLEGLNIGLLVPLLETLASPGEGSGHWVSQTFAALFDFIGLDFGLNAILLTWCILHIWGITT